MSGAESGMHVRVEPHTQAGPALTRSGARKSAWLDRNWPLYLLLGTLLACGCAWERIPVNRGAGWDGVQYVAWAMDMKGSIAEKRIDSYYMQRTLPSLLIWSVSRSLQVDLSEQQVLDAFVALNTCLLFLALMYYLRISAALGLSVSSKWLGYAFLFIIVPVAKLSTYYPALTDTTAFAIGMASMYYFIQRHRAALIVATLLGAFTYPSIIHANALLILFPPTPLNEPRERRLLDRALVLLSMLVALAIFLKFHSFRPPPFGNTKINSTLFPISAMALALYLYAVLRTFTPAVSEATQQFRSSLWRTGIAAIIALYVFRWFIIYTFGKHGSHFGLLPFISNIVYQPTVDPLINVVAHTMYYGMSIPLLLLRPGLLFAESRRLGLGMTLFVLSHLLLAMGSESRLFISALPAVAVLLIRGVDGLGLKGRSVLWIIALQLLLSRFWYPFNLQPFQGAYVEFPFQHYFMVHGPWMSHSMYYLQGSVVVIVTGVLAVLLKNRYTGVVAT